MKTSPFNPADYPFRENFADIGGLNMHYVDEGPGEADPLLLLHGVPSWSYLYRKMIVPLTGLGIRVIAPDMIGFGKSHKFNDLVLHTYQNHVVWMSEFIRKLNLQRVVLFGQDWGAVLGMHLAAYMPERFQGLIFSNGVVLTGEEKLPPAFQLWKYFARYSPWLPVGEIINRGCLRKLNRDEKRAYGYPFIQSSEKAGIRAMPSLIPGQRNHPNSTFGKEAWNLLEYWEKPVLCLFSENDPFTRGGEWLIRERIPGAKGQNHQLLPGGHFIQEDCWEELVRQISIFILGLPKKTG